MTVCRLFALCASALLLAGCEHKASLAADGKLLEKAFSLTMQSPKADPGDFKSAETPAVVKTLVDALQAQDLTVASQALHTLNFKGGGLSFDQFDAIRKTYGDVSGELARRAAKGDNQAQDLLNKMSPN